MPMSRPLSRCSCRWIAVSSSAVIRTDCGGVQVRARQQRCRLQWWRWWAAQRAGRRGRALRAVLARCRGYLAATMYGWRRQLDASRAARLAHQVEMLEEGRAELAGRAEALRAACEKAEARAHEAEVRTNQMQEA
eukprot:2937343-Pyramimonas_sp.AAC.1